MIHAADVEEADVNQDEGDELGEGSGDHECLCHGQTDQHNHNQDSAQQVSFNLLDGYISDSDDDNMSHYFNPHVYASIVEFSAFLTHELEAEGVYEDEATGDWTSHPVPDLSHFIEPEPPMIPFPFPPNLGTNLPTLNSAAMSNYMQQLMAFHEETLMILPWSEDTHPDGLTNPNPNFLGPSNYGLADMLRHWARQSRTLQGLPREKARCPLPSKITEMTAKDVKQVQYADLDGDLCDLQGIDWESLGVSRKEARRRRLLTYNNYVNVPASDRWKVSNMPSSGDKPSYFSKAHSCL
jgi:hypothetical protein